MGNAKVDYDPNSSPTSIDHYAKSGNGNFTDSKTMIEDLFAEDDWKRKLDKSGLKSWKKGKVVGWNDEKTIAMSGKSSKHHSDYSVLVEMSVELGDTVKDILDAIVTLGDTGTEVLNVIQTLLEFVTGFSKFLSINPVAAIVSEIISSVDEFMLKLEEQSINLLPIFPSDTYRGIDNVRSQLYSAFSYAERFRGMQGRVKATSEVLGKIRNGYLSPLAKSQEEANIREELLEKDLANTKVKKLEEILSATGPAFDTDSTVMGAGLLVSFPTPGRDVRKFINTWKQIWKADDYLKAGNELPTFLFNVRRKRESVRFSWTDIVAACSTTFYSKVAKLYSDGSEKNGTKPTGLSHDIKCYPHIRISLYKDYWGDSDPIEIIKNTEDAVEPDMAVREAFKDDKPFADIWICGLVDVDGGNKRSNYYINQMVVEELLTNMGDNIERLFPHDTEVLGDDDLGHSIYFNARVVKREDRALTGNHYSFPLESNDSVTYRVRLYTNESLIVPGDTTPELISVSRDDEEIAGYVPTRFEDYDEPPVNAIGSTPWMSIKPASIFPQIKTAFDFIRLQMVKINDWFETMDNPLQNIIKIIMRKKALFDSKINKIKETIAEVEKIVEILQMLSVSGSAWFMPPVNGSVYGETGGNDLLREEIEGALEYLESNGKIKSNEITMGMYFFAGVPTADNLEINNVMESIKSFCSIFNYFGIPEEKFNIPVTQLIRTIEGDTFIEGILTGVEVGSRIKGIALEKGTTITEIVEGGYTISTEAKSSQLSTQVIVSDPQEL